MPTMMGYFAATFKHPIVIAGQRAGLDHDRADYAEWTGDAGVTVGQSRLVERRVSLLRPGHTAGTSRIEEVNVGVDDRYRWGNGLGGLTGRPASGDRLLQA